MRRCTILWAALFTGAVLRPTGSSTVEELQVSIVRPIQGKWRVAELQLFSDSGCSKPLRIANESVYSSHPQSVKVPVLKPAQNRGQDCVDPCGGKPGYCNWCGEGNACCRKNFQADPEECRKAQGFTVAHHECVSVPAEALVMSSGVEQVLDGDLHTFFEATCPSPGGCPAASVTLAAALERKGAQVRCVLVSQARDDALFGAAVRASILRRPSPSGASSCPGQCRSGRYLEGSTDGVCKEYLSQHGWCGFSVDHQAHGTDCRGCSLLGAPTAQGYFNVVNRELRADGQLLISTLKDSSGTMWRSGPPAVEHVGEDCWGPCLSGFCSWCGEGNACCKHGRVEDMPECVDATSFVALTHHECVALLRNGAVAVGSLPPWLLATALLAPWLAIAAGVLCLLGRRGACCRCCARRERTEVGGLDHVKPLSGEVFKQSAQRDAEDEFRRKVLREQAKKLDWIA